MTEVRYVRPENRLAKLLVQPGGMKIATLLERAAIGVESMREATLLAIDAKIEDIAVIVASPDPRRFTLIRQYAGELFGDAGAFGLVEIAFAAGSLHDLLEFDEAPPSTTAVNVHLDAIRALRRPSVSQDLAARQAVLAALHQLSKSFAAHALKVAEAAGCSASTMANQISPAGQAAALDANIRELKTLALKADSTPEVGSGPVGQLAVAAQTDVPKREAQA